VPAQQPTPAPPAPMARKRPLLAWLAAGACAALLVICLVVFWSAENAPADPGPLALNVNHDGSVLRLTWDPAQAAVRDASDGILFVNDGDAHHRLRLSHDQLSQGSALYVPQSRDVDFRLEVRSHGRNVAGLVKVVQPPPSAKPSPMPMAQ